MSFFNVGNFFLNFEIIFFTLLSSVSGLITFDPGLVDSPPISIISAPKLINCLILWLAFLKELYLPPSEKLSGVRFKTPSIFGTFLNSKLEKFFFFVLIFFKSKLINNFLDVFIIIISVFLTFIYVVLSNLFLDKLKKWNYFYF